MFWSRYRVYLEEEKIFSLEMEGGSEVWGKGLVLSPGGRSMLYSRRGGEGVGKPHGQSAFLCCRSDHGGFWHTKIVTNSVWPLEHCYIMSKTLHTFNWFFLQMETHKHWWAVAFSITHHHLQMSLDPHVRTHCAALTHLMAFFTPWLNSPPSFVVVASGLHLVIFMFVVRKLLRRINLLRDRFSKILDIMSTF